MPQNGNSSPVWHDFVAGRLPPCRLTSRTVNAGEQSRWRRHSGEGAFTVDEVEIRDRIEMLKQDHRDLDAAIEALRLLPMPDMIQLQRFKKKKLLLKDEIAMLEDLLIPDIIA
jgi:hypothetical protein